ncbi:MAG: hypothetical protein JWM78_3107 [Verrucomicrobiaceae bacterium]|nr:hypothetical protein [Verrucomicrobiaceae bacterium]
MAKANKVFTQTNKAAPPIQHQRAIAEQTAAFLAGGGKIQQIPNGVSGQAKLGGPKLPDAPVAAAEAT